MSKPSTGKPPIRELPPGWTPLDASTVVGHLYVTVWREFHDITQFELDCAMAAPLDWLLPEHAVARVRALREAQGGRSDLPEDVWQRCVRLSYPTLSEHERQNPKEILTAIAVLRPVPPPPLPRRGPGRPPWTEELFLERWREAESEAAPSDRLADIATSFRILNGAGGVDPDYLRRLRARFMRPTEIPE